MGREDGYELEQLEGQSSAGCLNVATFAENVSKSAKQFGAQVHVDQQFKVGLVAAQCDQLGKAILDRTAVVFSPITKLFLAQTDNE